MFGVDAEKAVLDVAADGEHFTSKAKVYVRDGYIGVTRKEVKPIHWINLYRKKSGSIHGCPGNE